MFESFSVVKAICSFVLKILARGLSEDGRKAFVGSAATNEVVIIKEYFILCVNLNACPGAVSCKPW